jgi:hypothetical protein
MTDEQFQDIKKELEQIRERLSKIDDRQSNLIETLIDAILELKPKDPDAIRTLIREVNKRKT